jgi:hypothetical protein
MTLRPLLIGVGVFGISALMLSCPAAIAADKKLDAGELTKNVVNGVVEALNQRARDIEAGITVDEATSEQAKDMNKMRDKIGEIEKMVKILVEIGQKKGEVTVESFFESAEQ